MYKWISFLMVFIALLVPLPSQAQVNDPKVCNDELSRNPTRHVRAHEMLDSVYTPIQEFSPNEAVVNVIAYSVDLKANQCGLQEQVLVIIFALEVWRLNMNYVQGLIDEEYYNERLVAWEGYRDNFVVVAYCLKFTIACRNGKMMLGNEFLDSLDAPTVDS